jgi:UDP-glucuronate decarboxylase
MDIDDGRVVTNIIKRVIHNKPVIIQGTGNQTRSFCYIDDMLDGLVALMASKEVGPINLGNPATECSINQLIQAFERVFGFKVITTHVEKTENDPRLRRPDISMAKKLLGFAPKIGLEDGLHKTLTHFISLHPPESTDL